MTKLIAEIRALKGWDASPQVEVTVVFTWDGHSLEVPKGKDTPMFRSIAEEGIYGRFNNHYTMDDGEAFIRELPWALHGSYCWASLREE